MEGLILVAPKEEYKKQAEEYIQEFREHNSEVNGASMLDAFLENDDYGEWLLKIATHGKGFVEEGYVQADTYFAVRERDNKIIGTINIRHIFNGDLADEGWSHIGYAVRPMERRKGYATEILRLGLTKCAELGLRKVLITCGKNNIASAKTILNNGGVYIDEITEEDGITERYWIAIK